MQQITSRKNPQLQHLKKLGTDRAYREITGVFLCDGLKLYEEARQAGMEIPLLATSYQELATDATCPVVLVPEDVLHSISPLKNPQPLLFACIMPDNTPIATPKQALILDGIQDPGNMGTLLRSATAFGIEQVILVGDCVDIYNPKTVRAAMGALFRQRVCMMTIEELVEYTNQNGLTLLGAALKEDAKAIGGPLPERVAIAIGNEGQGLSTALLSQCHGTIKIPMEAYTESLNAGVAGSILLWELYRNREGTIHG
ncbi:MAG: RNA methyltransferase [Oscillospiraceae bacterium]|nr:RNA methyltransferase [Oscillospiraceae bacterium]